MNLPNLCAIPYWSEVLFLRHRWIWKIYQAKLINFLAQPMSWCFADCATQWAVVEHFVHFVVLSLFNFFFVFLMEFSIFSIFVQFLTQLVSLCWSTTVLANSLFFHQYSNFTRISVIKKNYAVFLLGTALLLWLHNR